MTAILLRSWALKASASYNGFLQLVLNGSASNFDDYKILCLEANSQYSTFTLMNAWK